MATFNENQLDVNDSPDTISTTTTVATKNISHGDTVFGDGLINRTLGWLNPEKIDIQPVITQTRDDRASSAHSPGAQ